MKGLVILLEMWYILWMESLSSFIWMLCNGFHVIFWWHALCDSLQWRSPQLACRGSVVDQCITHIRRHVESLIGTNVDWDTRGHHTGFSEANAKEGYLVYYVTLKINLGGFKPWLRPQLGWTFFVASPISFRIWWWNMHSQNYYIFSSY